MGRVYVEAATYPSWLLAVHENRHTHTHIQTHNERRIVYFKCIAVIGLDGYRVREGDTWCEQVDNGFMG